MGALAIVLEVVNQAIKLAPQAVSTWNDLKPFATSLYAQIKGSAPTEAEVTEMEAKIDELAARLQVPLPEAQPGDPDYVKPV